MSDRTAIEWTDSTWNPWMGCTKVSPACASCYMFREMRQYGRNPEVVTRTKPATFNKPLRWQKQAAENGDRRLVFTCSWSDWFHPAADAWRDDAWAIVRDCPDVTFQILTKRPELIADRLPVDWADGYPNVWLGVSVENPRFYWRLDELCAIPAALRFVSAEPLLKPIDLRPWLTCAVCGGVGWYQMFDRWESGFSRWCSTCSGTGRGALAWVIAGGESVGRPGHPPRLTHPDWIRTLRDQCATAGVPFLFKQRGGTRKASDGAWGGRELDGQTWDGMPVEREAVTA